MDKLNEYKDAAVDYIKQNAFMSICVVIIIILCVYMYYTYQKTGGGTKKDKVQNLINFILKKQGIEAKN